VHSGPLIIKGFGFNARQTILLNIPFGFVQASVCVIGCLITARSGYKGAVLIAFMLPCVLGSGLLYGLGEEREMQTSREKAEGLISGRKREPSGVYLEGSLHVLRPKGTGKVSVQKFSVSGVKVVVGSDEKLSRDTAIDYICWLRVIASQSISPVWRLILSYP
jgi:hypothetical protein